MMKVRNRIILVKYDKTKIFDHAHRSFDSSFRVKGAAMAPEIARCFKQLLREASTTN